MKGERRLLGILLSLALVTGIILAMSLTAWADEPQDATWETNQNFTESADFCNVAVKNNITISIASGKTVTAKYIRTDVETGRYTLTVTGGGTLVIKAPDGSDGDANHIPGYDGSNAFYGNITVDGATVKVTGGNGGKGCGEAEGVVLNAGGGHGGYGIGGNVTVKSGSISVIGGKGGEGVDGGNHGPNGSAVYNGTITATTAEESEDGNTWTAITGTSSGASSEKQYVRAPAVTEYPLWVGGTQVTSANKDDVFNDQKVSYTPATDTSAAILKLNGYDNEGAVGDKYAGIYAKEDLIIETTGTNTVANTSTETGTRAIGVDGDLTLQGSGKLNATRGKRTIEANAVTIESGTVKTSNGDYGITASSGEKGSITINGGEVNASGRVHGLHAINNEVIIKKGTVVATSSTISRTSIAINAGKNIKIEGGTVEATGFGGITANQKVMINAGSVKATGIIAGIVGSESVAINNGTIEATATADGSMGIYGGNVMINNGQVIASASDGAIAGNVKNAIAGTGWTNKEGTEGKTAIAIKTDGQDLTAYKKVQFPAEVEPTPTPTPTPAASPISVTTTAKPSARSMTVKWTWNNVPGAKSYKVSYHKVGSKKWTTKKTKKTKYVVKGHKMKGLYEYKVAAVTASGDVWSNTSCRYFKGVKTKAKAGKAAGTVRASWKKDKGATGYQVKLATNKKLNGAQVVNVSANQKSYTFSGLKSGKKYYVSVRPLKDHNGVTYQGIRCKALKVKTK